MFACFCIFFFFVSARMSSQAVTFYENRSTTAQLSVQYAAIITLIIANPFYERNRYIQKQYKI